MDTTQGFRRLALRSTARFATQPAPPPKRASHVSSADLRLLFKKFTVGLVIAAIPILILAGGLQLTRTLLGTRKQPAPSNPASHQSSRKALYENGSRP